MAGCFVVVVCCSSHFDYSNGTTWVYFRTTTWCVSFRNQNTTEKEHRRREFFLTFFSSFRLSTSRNRMRSPAVLQQCDAHSTEGSSRRKRLASPTLLCTLDLANIRSLWIFCGRALCVHLCVCVLIFDRITVCITNICAVAAHSLRWICHAKQKRDANWPTVS